MLGLIGELMLNIRARKRIGRQGILHFTSTILGSKLGLGGTLV